MRLRDRWRAYRARVRQAEDDRRAADAAEFDRRMAIGARVAASVWIGLLAGLAVYHSAKAEEAPK